MSVMTEIVDRIERLSPYLYIRWTSGPNYETAFICVEDAEPDMNEIAEVSFTQAHTFALAFQLSLDGAGR